MFDTDTNVVSELLTGAAVECDLPAPLRRDAEREYEALGRWLTDNADDGADWKLYSQGSMRLNTVTRPSQGCEYDLDTVAEWDVDKDSVSKDELKDVVGGYLRRYVTSCGGRSGGPVRAKEKRRCWTLEYKDRPFHFDVLPTVPDVENRPTGIRLTDKDLTRWLWGDPIAYANWFRGRVADELLERKALVASASKVDVEDIPDADAPTLLHRAVQVFKIHRDNQFEPDDDLKPASILITTLAAQAYSGGYTSLLDALTDLAARMPLLIERDARRYVVLNPVQKRENFADRWTADHARQFHAWLGSMRNELDAAAHVTSGLDVLVASLGHSFGVDTMRRSAQRYGESLSSARSQGVLRVGATGALTTRSSGVRVREHVFDGD